MMIPAKRSFLFDTGRQFAEQTTIHGVSYIAFLLNKREISFLAPLNPHLMCLIYFSAYLYTQNHDLNLSTHLNVTAEVIFYSFRYEVDFVSWF